MRRRALVLAAAASLAAVVAWVAAPLPRGLLEPGLVQSVTLVDRDGVVLRTTRAGDGTRTRWTPLIHMDPKVLLAFIALEDRRFFSHPGVDPLAVLRAARDNLRAGRVVSGASTITMQLARLLRPGARSLPGKVGQALWAVRLEAHLAKQTILEQYLNRVPLGQGVVGVPAAAALYFGASPDRLSLGQAATLAALARAPSSANPFLAPDRARSRRALALEGMEAQGYATRAEVSRARLEPLVPPRTQPPFLAPHFTSRVLTQVEDSAGGSGDGVWVTSLDLALQRGVETEVHHAAAVIKEHGGQHAAAVVLDNPTGEILAWVGSPDFWADSVGQVDMVVSPRQPGSTLKPFLYGLALDQGFTAASVLPDIPRTYDTPTGPYRPRNYDRTFHGPVRLREALASSYNVPAVDAASMLGAAGLLHTLHLAGFASLGRDAEYYGLGLALGNGDVTLLELANGYRALANDGVWRPWRFWRGTAGAEPGETERRVVSSRAAALILDILSDPIARVPGFGPTTPFDNLPFPLAVKTGTSRHFTDNWAVGVTGRFTAAVWVGNFSGRPMRGISGVSGAGPLLRRVVLETAARYQPGTLATPREMGAEPVRICRVSGLRATAYCPETTEWFFSGTAPDRECDWHSPLGLSYPVDYVSWAAERGSSGSTRIGPPRTVTAAPARNASAPRFRIVSPQDGDRYQVPPGVAARYATIGLRVTGAAADARVRWWIDGAQIREPRWQLTPGRHTIRAESGSAVDQVQVEVR